MEESSPIMDHGSMFDGVWGPPASKPGWIRRKTNYSKPSTGLERHVVTCHLYFKWCILVSIITSVPKCNPF
jgi:hypothetical protein